VDRYSFIVVDLHHLFLAGLPAHFESSHPSHAVGNAGKGEQAKSYHRIFDLGKNRNLYIFAACVFLFQFADASLLPVVGQNLAQSEIRRDVPFVKTAAYEQYYTDAAA
jgi:hypothetical protein